MFRFLILLTFALVAVDGSGKEECVTISSCKCRHSKGIMDLSGLRGHKFSATFGALEILYFPCQQLVDLGSNCKQEDNNAVCVKNSSQVAVWGTQGSVKFIVPNTNDYRTLMAEFSFKPKLGATRRTQLYIHCPKQGDTTPTQFKVDNYQENDIAVTLETEMGCFVSVGSSAMGSGYLLLLELIVIIALVLGSLSIVAVCRYRRGERGHQLVSHKRTLVAVCGLFVDGIRTALCCFPQMRRNIGTDRTTGYESILPEEY